jgi:molybdopterin-guanine dinucleotide biosynthesis protein A
VDRPAVAGLLLTGGSSRRMGADKATLGLPDGSTWAATVARRLAAATHPVLEVGPGVSGLSHVTDRRPGSGPLAAVAGGAGELARRGHAGAAVVVACDMPFVGEGLLRLLAGWPGTDSVVPVVAGVPQPLCCRLSPVALAAAGALVRSGIRSMRAALDAAPVVYLPEARWSPVASPRELLDVDTPDDARRLGLAVEPGGNRR